MFMLERINNENQAFIVFVNGKRTGKFIGGIYYPETIPEWSKYPPVSIRLMEFLVEQYKIENNRIG